MKISKIAVILVVIVAYTLFRFSDLDPIRAQTATPAAPTGLIASNGSYASKIGLNWDPIRGALIYRIFRSQADDPNSAVEIGETPALSFFDADPNQGIPYFYWVRAENGSAVGPMSSSAQGLRALGLPSGPLPALAPPPIPSGNPLTGAKIALGKALFWDEQLSSTRTVACGTCHIFSSGGSDPRSIVGNPAATNPGPDGLFGSEDDISGSPGVPRSDASGNYEWNSFGVQPQVTARHSMSVVNSAYVPRPFWDGRAGTTFRDPITDSIILSSGGGLESQVLGPPTSDIEMGHVARNWNEVALQIQNSKPLALASNVPNGLSTWIGHRTYPELFNEAFGTSEVTPVRIAMAIATYERTLYSDRTPLDLLAESSDLSVLTAAEQRGQEIFNSSTCTLCHTGPLQTNNAFNYIGVRPVNEDLGRFAISGTEFERGAFKAPSLRNVSLRGSFMHNGRFATLESVLAFYNRGADFTAPNLAGGIFPLGLGEQELTDLVAFLRRPLTDPRVQNETPPFDRPTLYTESARVPVVSGNGRAGSGGTVPKITALEPPLLGNPAFTVAVSDSIPGAEAVLVVDSADPGISSSVPVSGSFRRAITLLQNNGAGVGYGSVTIDIPNDSSLIGQTLFARWYIPDSAAVNGFSVSPLVQFTIFGESPIAQNVTISGRVLTPNGLGIRNATVLLSLENGTRYRVLTNAFGSYTFQDIPSNTNCVINASARRYVFEQRPLALFQDLSDIDFVGEN